MLRDEQTAEPLCWCEVCGGECYSAEYSLGGASLCPGCYEFLQSPEAVADYIYAYPGRFSRWLKLDRWDDDRVVSVLEEYREDSEDLFQRWALS